MWNVTFFFAYAAEKQTGIYLVGVFHNSGDLKGFSDTWSCRHYVEDTGVLCSTVDSAAESAETFTVR